MHISDHSFLAFSLECHETPISPSFLSTREPKLGQYWPKSDYFWGAAAYITMPHFMPFLPCVLLRMSENPNFITFFRPLEGRNCADTGQNRIISVRIHQRATFQTISSMCSPQNVWNPQFIKFFWPPEGQHWARSNRHFGRGQETPARHI